MTGNWTRPILNLRAIGRHIPAVSVSSIGTATPTADDRAHHPRKGKTCYPRPPDSRDMITEDARALLATGTVCDSCLGRPFAERSFGLTNAERGRALRTTVALADDEGLRSNRPGGLLGLRRLLRDVRRHRRRDRRRPSRVRVRHLPGRQPHPTAESKRTNGCSGRTRTSSPTSANR